MTRANRSLVVGSVATAFVAAAAFTPSASGTAAEGPAFALETTVMVDDGLGTCAVETQLVVDPGQTFRVCYTMTNTGSEALSLHAAWDTRLGQVVGPGDATIVEPGETMSTTATGSNMVSMFHKVTWSATGVDSGVEVEQVDYVYLTIDGFTVQLDVTAMVDDGTDTCGTETALSAAAGTAVRFCYTMTNTSGESLDGHFLLDEQLGTLLAFEGPSIDPGDTLVETAVAVVDEGGTRVAYWQAYGEQDDPYQAIDSMTIEITDPAQPTTTTQSCVTTTVVTTTTPPATDPSTTIVATTTTTSTTTTTTTSTTTTMPPTFTTTTSTTSPIIVLPTTSPTLPPPPGFARSERGSRQAVAPCPETPPGGSLPATGSSTPALVAVATLMVALGGGVLEMARRRN